MVIMNEIERISNEKRFSSNRRQSVEYQSTLQTDTDFLKGIPLKSQPWYEIRVEFYEESSKIRDNRTFPRILVQSDELRVQSSTMVKMRAAQRLRKTVEQAVYALAIGGSSLLLMLASFADGTSWMTRVMLAIVTLNGLILTTSLFFEEIDRRHLKNDVSAITARARGPSASLLSNEQPQPSNYADDESAFLVSFIRDGHTKSTIADDVLPTRTPKLPEEELLVQGSVLPQVGRSNTDTNDSNSRNSSDDRSSPVLSSNGESKQAPEQQTTIDRSQARREHPAYKLKALTSRDSFRPLRPEDTTSVLAKSKRFRQLEGRIAAGIWYERAYKKTKRLSKVFTEYDAIRKELLQKTD
jgi:hypothetical protein